MPPTQGKRNAKRTRVERGLYVKNGIYSACAADSAGQMVWKSLGPVNLAEARRTRDAFVATIRSTRAVDATAPLADVAGLFLAEQQHLVEVSELRPSTLRNHEEAVRLHLNGLGSKPTSSIRADDLVRWHHEQISKGYAAWTIRRHWSTLRSILGFAARKGYATGNPADLLTRRERPKPGKPKLRYLENRDIAALVDASGERYRTGLMLMLFCGLRISELLGLRWRDVSFAEGVIWVTGQVHAGERLDYAKTAAGSREVVLMDTLANVLKQHKLASAFSRPDDFVLTSLTGSPMDVRNLRRRGLQAACDRAGLAGVTAHTLRHTYASVLIAQGHDPVYVAAQMGHARPSITLDTYAHLFARAKNAEKHRSALDAEFGRIVEPVSG